MKKKIEQLVSELPEIYQTIFGHPQWNSDAARDCNQRLLLIKQYYDQLSEALGRPLRVLDLGCAQGFFSLSLAGYGATVKGIDFQQQNIDACQALAEENPAFDISFENGRVEDVVSCLEKDQYDLVIGLSVFHHIVHLHGAEQVKAWLSHLADCTQIVILELALQQEPLYWGVSQPTDPRELINNCAFYYQTGSFNTHLSDIYRPMYLVSNHWIMLPGFCRKFGDWTDQPYRGAGLAHKKSRRYYYGDDFICKLFAHGPVEVELTVDERERNSKEIADEAAFLSKPPAGFPVPELLANGSDSDISWLVMEKLPGRLLSDLLADGQPVDAGKLLSDILEQLVNLEKEHLYHDDIRTWNILVDENSQARLIDFGSISSVRRDCSWPDNLFLSFFIFVNEIFGLNGNFLGFWRSAPSHPFRLNSPWSGWLYAFWQHPVDQWSYHLLKQLFDNRDSLPEPDRSLTATELWGTAQETVLLEMQTRVRQLTEQRAEHEPGAEDPNLRLIRLEAAFDDLALQHKQLAEQTLAVEHAAELAAEPVHTEVPADVAELLLQLEQSRRELNRYQQENQQLQQEIEKIHRSRSWKLTRPYRYAGLQVILLKQYGVKQRCKHLAKRVLSLAICFFRRHPALKQQVVKLLYKTGLYHKAFKLYQRMSPLHQANIQAESQSQSETEKQIANPDLLPSEVNDLFHRLTKRK
ncbi:methyltransferase domain-containing protein [Tatumella sp. UBA2305]|uniref:methyltransferase domain-containing protein n=1 Tax=Tatumella sp. UBA2305 TaxID=1947647 RepID=UPI0025D63737|nr:methyltransferase domain-containing protein [Tatumella sp. UBA2305]